LRFNSIAYGALYTLTILATTGYAPNSDILAANDSANGNWAYTYDDFNRLASATQSGQPAYTDVYDRYGNRWKQLYNGACTAGSTFCATFDGNNHNNNGLLVYDAAGNVTQDNMHHYGYDGENRLVSVDSGTTAAYVYDAEGKRVRKTTGGLSVDYVYDLAGAATTEFNSTGGWNRGEVYAGGRHVATYAASTTYFDLRDWLGTERVRTTAAGVKCETVTSLAFGDGQAVTGSCGDPSPLHFTGKQRDTETGLDNFGARYNSSSFGRFMIADPVGGQVSDPQSLNLYSYVRNNPLVFVDPTGMVVVWNDSKAKCQKNETECRTNAQRAYEDRLKQLRESKNAKDRSKGDKLAQVYQRLQDSKAVFEVTNDRSSGPNAGEITYQGKDHFTINLHGDDRYGLTDNQRLAHEFEHGRQVLDGELSFQMRGGAWLPFAHDLTDEAKGFEAAFAIEGASPGEGATINGISRALNTGGIPHAAHYLGEHVQGYQNLPIQVNVPNPPPPNVYVVPQ